MGHVQNRLVTFMKVNGVMIKLKVTEYMNIWMEQNMLVTGKMTDKMDIYI